MLLLFSLSTFTSFDRVAALKILQRYSLFVLFVKCTKAGEAFLHCKELTFLETNVDVVFDLI